MPYVEVQQCEQQHVKSVPAGYVSDVTSKASSTQSSSIIILISRPAL